MHTFPENNNGLLWVALYLDMGFEILKLTLSELKARELTVLDTRSMSAALEDSKWRRNIWFAVPVTGMMYRFHDAVR